jgi:hypothetical protein
MAVGAPGITTGLHAQLNGLIYRGGIRYVVGTVAYDNRSALVVICNVNLAIHAALCPAILHRRL